MTKPFLLFVVGPTACGKSDAAVCIAEKFRAQPRPSFSTTEIINSDSVQFFDGVDIGAAKPEPELLARVPHHLVGHVAKGLTYTAGDFRRDSLKVIEPVNEKAAKDFVVVGGSGFYVQALEKGMYDVPAIPPEVRAQLENEADQNLESLHVELTKRDPVAAAKIEKADRYRLVRALEILRFSTTGESLTEIRARFEKEMPPAPFTSAKIGIFRPRDILRQRVIERTQKMLAVGFIEEVEALRAEGLNSWAPMQSVGYKEVQDFLDAKLSRDEMFEAIVTSTMQLAKRQMTWFKRDKSIVWMNSEIEASSGYTKAIGLSLQLRDQLP